MDGARDTEGCGVGGRLGTEEGLIDTDGCGLGCRLGMEEGLVENDGEIVGCSDVVGAPEGIDDGCRHISNRVEAYSKRRRMSVHISSRVQLTQNRLE